MSETRPEVLLSRADYLEDIKVRWQIHTYEWNKLMEDLQEAYDYVLPFLKKSSEYVVDRYQQLRTAKWHQGPVIGVFLMLLTSKVSL